MSEAQILKPFGDYKTPGPNDSVIEMLREALAHAESGECVGVAIAMLAPSGFVKTRAVQGSRGMAELLGAVALMQDDLIRRWKADD
jgi:hypothetical protein